MIVREARIALGAVAPKPLLVPDAGEYLAGRALDVKSIEEAARISTEHAKPITDHRGSAEYRKTMIEILVKRVLNMSRERAVSGLAEGRA